MITDDNDDHDYDDTTIPWSVPCFNRHDADSVEMVRPLLCEFGALSCGGDAVPGFCARVQSDEMKIGVMLGRLVAACLHTRLLAMLPVYRVFSSLFDPSPRKSKKLSMTNNSYLSWLRSIWTTPEHKQGPRQK